MPTPTRLYFHDDYTGATTGAVPAPWVDRNVTSPVSQTISGGARVFSATAAEITAGYSWSHTLWTLPDWQNRRDQRAVLTLPAGFSPSGAAVGGCFRLQSTGEFYFVGIATGSISLIGSNLNAPGLSPYQTGTFTYNGAHAYTADISVTGASPTTITVVVTDLTTNAVTTVTFTDSTLTACQGLGAFGLAANLDGLSSSASVKLADLKLYNADTPVNDPNIYYPPGAWAFVGAGTQDPPYTGATAVQTEVPGHYLKFALSVPTGQTGSVVVYLDTSAEEGHVDFATGEWPVIGAVIDGAAEVKIQAGPTTGGRALTFTTTLAPGNHTVILNAYPGGPWEATADAPLDAWALWYWPARITGFGLGGAATTTAYGPVLPRSKRGLGFGDSITAGTGTTAALNGHNRWLDVVMSGLDCEYGGVWYGTTGFAAQGTGGPPLTTVWNQLDGQGHARTFTGIDYLTIFHGANDFRSGTTPLTATIVRTQLENFRSACGPNTLVALIVPPGNCFNAYGSVVSAIAGGFAAYRSAHPADNRTVLIDVTAPFLPYLNSFAIGANALSIDGIHPNDAGHAQLGGAILGEVRRQEAAAAASASASRGLTVAATSAAPNGVQLAAPTGQALYLTLDVAGKRWNGSALETLDASHWPSYAVGLAEAAAGTGVYLGTVPAGLAARASALTVYARAGATPAPSDPVVGSGRYAPGPAAEVLDADAGFSVQRADLVGQTVYAVIDSGAGNRWNGTTFEAIQAGHWSTYVVPGVEDVAGRFTVEVPPAVDLDYVNATFYRQSGVTPAPTDEVLGSSSAAAELVTSASVAAAVAATPLRLAAGGLDAVTTDPASGLNAAQALSAIAAVLCGKCAIDGNTVTFFAPSSTVPRVVSTTDGTGNRTAVSVSL